MDKGYETVMVEKGIDPNTVMAMMQNGKGMDPATLMAMMNNNQEDDYFKWIILLGILRGGFFGEEGKAAATGVLESQLQSIRDTQTTNALAGRDGQTAILQAIQAAAAASQQCCCDTQGKVAAVGATVQADGSATRQSLCNTQNDLQQALAAGFAQQAACCCDTQRIVESTSCETQRAIDKCCCETQIRGLENTQNIKDFTLGETNRLQDNFDSQNALLSRMAQQAALDTQGIQNSLGMGFAGVDKSICDQTNILTAQGVANTQRIIDGQQRILDTMSENRIRELESINTQLRTEALLNQQTQAITQACGCCGGEVQCRRGWHHPHGNGNGNGNGNGAAPLG